jgi:mannose-6-phosphate isomerase-like protein (cupin superfamily)
LAIVSEELIIAPGTTLRVLGRDDGLLELEATYAGAGNPPPAHLHPEQDERFEVLAGTMQTRIDGRDGQITAGEVIEITRGTAHRMWNPASEPAVVNWKTMPAGRTLEWFRGLAGLQHGESGVDGAALLAEYADVFRLADG